MLTIPFGFGERSWIFELTVCWIALLYILSALILGWAARSWKAALAMTVLCTAFGLVFTPWTSLRTFQTSNPDVIFWHRHFRVMTWTWIMIFSASFVSMPMLLWLQKRYSVPSRRKSSHWFRRAAKKPSAPARTEATPPSSGEEKEENDHPHPAPRWNPSQLN